MYFVLTANTTGHFLCAVFYILFPIPFYSLLLKLFQVLYRFPCIIIHKIEYQSRDLDEPSLSKSDEHLKPLPRYRVV